MPQEETKAVPINFEEEAAATVIKSTKTECGMKSSDEFTDLSEDAEVSDTDSVEELTSQPESIDQDDEVTDGSSEYEPSETAISDDIMSDGSKETDGDSTDEGTSTRREELEKLLRTQGWSDLDITQWGDMQDDLDQAMRRLSLNMCAGVMESRPYYIPG